MGDPRRVRRITADRYRSTLGARRGDPLDGDQAAARGQGLGSRLLDHVLRLLVDDGADVVEVKTLDRTAGYARYEAAPAYWERRGFVQVDTIDPLPGWQLGSPAAIYVAALRSTR